MPQMTLFWSTMQAPTCEHRQGRQAALTACTTNSLRQGCADRHGADACYRTATLQLWWSQDRMRCWTSALKHRSKAAGFCAGFHCCAASGATQLACLFGSFERWALRKATAMK